VWFISVNRKLSKRLAGAFLHTRNTVSDNYPTLVGKFAGEGCVVVDVGGGAQCAFAKECPGSHIIAVDISASELQKNCDVADRRVGDVTKQIPLPDDSADVVASRFVLEHLQGVEHFVEEVQRVLRPGGVFITLFPNKYAPFSFINRLLPAGLARRVAYALKEGAEEYGIFPAYYECCSPRAFRKLLEKNGFISVKAKVTYDQSCYFHFFLPLALLSLCYEWIISRLDLVSLSAHVQVCATKQWSQGKTADLDTSDWQSNRVPNSAA
jgi:2-polyprenyl-6-hydroxyphenyl methylase/3-demethylubiquinone-9 3-methyltransferase